MPTFLATRTTSVGEEFQAETWEEAETHCEERGWRLDGIVLDAVVQTAPEHEAPAEARAQ